MGTEGHAGDPPQRPPRKLFFSRGVSDAGLKGQGMTIAGEVTVRCPALCWEDKRDWWGLEGPRPLKGPASRQLQLTVTT